MQPFKIGVDAKNLQVTMNPSSHDKPTNSITSKNLEIKVSSAVLEVSVRDQNPSVKEKAKRILEGYVSKMKNALEDKSIRPKLEPSLKKKIEEAFHHANEWLKYVQNPQANDTEIEKNMKLNKQYYEDIITKIRQLKHSSSST
ncbi:hypothetical protein I3760_06G026400 [Carya illinoinensis]|nr:hypothetical protein I3760_06G026400 [Carya illinoinensis]